MTARERMEQEEYQILRRWRRRQRIQKAGYSPKRITVSVPAISGMRTESSIPNPSGG